MRRLLAAVWLALLATAAGSLPSQPSARAEEADPDARLEIILKNVHVFDDNDWWFDGEITLNAMLYECKQPVSSACHAPSSASQNREVTSASTYIEASSDSYAPLNNLTLPSPASRGDPGAAGHGGFEVSADKEYGLAIAATEGDLDWTDENGQGVSFIPDDLGTFKFPLRSRDNWSVGNHVVRSVKGSAQGDYDVAFEVRRKSLPDLVVSNIGLRRLDDGRDVVCVTFGNVGPEPVGTLTGSLKVDGVAIPAGNLKWPRLEVGDVRDFCVGDGLPLGRHVVSFDIDDDRAVPEMDEKNNHIEQLMTITSAASADAAANTGGSQPTGNQTPTEAALSVTSIRLQGANVNDCDAGQHRIVVRIKNDDDAAIDVTVRLIVDDDLDTAREQSGIRVEGDRSVDVSFDGVRLNKGERSLTSRVLSVNPSTEANDSDNRRRITFSCDD